MASLNKVMLIGTLGRDPEIRHMPNGEAVANFSMATTESWKDKSGVKQEKTEWHNIVMYRKLAEIAGEYLKKGRPVYIEGRLQTRKWEKDGVTRYATEIIADSMQMLGGNRDKDSGGSNDNSGGYDGQQQDNQQSQSSQQRPQQSSAPAQNSSTSTGGGYDEFENDIPF